MSREDAEQLGREVRALGSQADIRPPARDGLGGWCLFYQTEHMDTGGQVFVYDHYVSAYEEARIYLGIDKEKGRG